MAQAAKVNNEHPVEQAAELVFGLPPIDVGKIGDLEGAL
jgi:hypothetical protein